MDGDSDHGSDDEDYVAEEATSNPAARFRKRRRVTVSVTSSSGNANHDEEKHDEDEVVSTQNEQQQPSNQLHRKNEDDAENNDEPGCKMVVRWLKEIKRSNYAENFANCEIDWLGLNFLEEEDVTGDFLNSTTCGNRSMSGSVFTSSKRMAITSSQMSAVVAPVAPMT